MVLSGGDDGWIFASFDAYQKGMCSTSRRTMTLTT